MGTRTPRLYAFSSGAYSRDIFSGPTPHALGRSCCFALDQRASVALLGKVSGFAFE